MLEFCNIFYNVVVNMWHVFPENSLATSFVVTVWLGICILCFFNRRFGWAMSGLVVPGLLAPTFMAKPVAGMTILIEALATYLAVRATSRVLPRLFQASELFGRDRFFAMLLFSVPIRLITETWLAPDLIAPALARTGLFGDSLYDPMGIGLVVVPLLANQLWKPGLARGMASAVVTLGVTAVIIRWVLIPFTNFDFNNLVLVLDALSTRIEDSPKSYIVLLTTAFIASQINLRYGWEFGGILFPALLGLGLFDPLRLVTTFAEALFLFFAGTWLLQLKWFKSRGIEGAQRTLLFFNLAFAYRMISGYVAEVLYPQATGDDFLALGFLISTMLAIRASDRHNGIQLIRSIGQISILGTAAGLVLSFGLVHWRDVTSRPIMAEQRAPFPEDYAVFPTAKIPGARPAQARLAATRQAFCPLPDEITPSQAIKWHPDRRIAGLLRERALAEPDFFAAMGSEAFLPSRPSDLARLRSEVLRPLLQAVQRIASHPGLERNMAGLAKQLGPIHERAQRFGFGLHLVGNKTKGAESVILTESRVGDALCHRGLVAFRLKPKLDAVVTTSRPLVETGTLEAATQLFDKLGARALVLPTAHPLANADASADVTSYANRMNFFVMALEEITRAEHDDPLMMLDVKAWETTQETLDAASGSIPPQMVLAYGESYQASRALDTLTASFESALRLEGLSFATKDGSLLTSRASEPSPTIEAIAARGEAIRAVTLSIHDGVLAQLTPLTRMSRWQAAWHGLGLPYERIDAERHLRSHFFRSREKLSPLGDAATREIEAYLDDHNFLHLARLKKLEPDLTIKMIEDAASTTQLLTFEAPSQKAGALYLVHGLWPAPAHGPSQYVSLNDMLSAGLRLRF